MVEVKTINYLENENGIFRVGNVVEFEYEGYDYSVRIKTIEKQCFIGEEIFVNGKSDCYQELKLFYCEKVKNLREEYRAVFDFDSPF